MKNKKGFTLIELIIVIAILAIIMLIGTAAYSSIQERMKVRADKATAAQIGKAIKIRETDVGEENGIGLYPEVIEYDSIDGIENYIAKEIKPQSMEDGNFVATAFQTQTGKKIVVGIGKKVGEEGSESYSIGDKVYNGKDESGWAWSEDTKIEEFLKDESVSGSISSGGTVDVFPGVAIKANTEVEVGDYIYYTPGGGTTTITGAESGLDDENETLEEEKKLSNTTQIFTVNATESKWRVIANNGGQLDIVPAGGNIGKSLKLYGKAGYANAIGILNRICGNYADGDKYAAGAVSLGYEAGSFASIDQEKIDFNSVKDKVADSTAFWNAYNSNDNTTVVNKASSLSPYLDLGWYNLEKNYSSTTLKNLISSSVWLASRKVRVYGSLADFDMCYLRGVGSVSKSGLYSEGYISTYSLNNTYGVCPRVSLKSGIKILEGEGTLSKPYSMTKTEVVEEDS